MDKAKHHIVDIFTIWYSIHEKEKLFVILNVDKNTNLFWVRRLSEMLRYGIIKGRNELKEGTGNDNV